MQRCFGEFVQRYVGASEIFVNAQTYPSNRYDLLAMSLDENGLP
jgi:hypothetical protein